jgi:hypothetical protein
MTSSIPFSPTIAQIAMEPLAANELDYQVTAEDGTFLDEFQDAWSKFLIARPELVPKGRLGPRLESLQQQAEFERATNEAVGLELRKQLQFFTSSRESLENLFTFKLNEAMEQQRELHDELQSKLDTVAFADQIQTQTVPWMHFLLTLDRLNAEKTAAAAAGAAGSASKPEGDPPSNRAVKPSARAMALTDQSSGDSSDIMLRAYRTDHALLTTNITKLQKEIERHTKMIESQEVAGLFLTEHNVWSLISNKNVSESASENTKSGEYAKAESDPSN